MTDSDTFHKDGRNFKTASDMMERINAAEADTAMPSESFTTKYPDGIEGSAAYTSPGASAS